MCESVTEKIDRFQRYNRTLIAHALAKCNHRISAIHTSVLLCSILDSLAKVNAPQINRNGDRFRHAIERHSNWNERNKVSLLHLTRLLDDQARPQVFDPLHQWALKELNLKLPMSHAQIFLGHDPDLSAVVASWPMNSNNKQIELNGFVPSFLTHTNLLWLYRNSMVHEYRKPGNGSESAFRREFNPYYQRVGSIVGFTNEGGFTTHDRWELVYPTAFIAEIVKSVLDGICDDYRSIGSSPFGAYTEGSYWIPKLN